MAPGQAADVRIFISYAHEDEELRDQLVRHLASLSLKTPVDVWYDRKIGAGGPWEPEIKTHFDSSQIILLLVSADFFASEYCNKYELRRALELRRAGKATVIPIIVREVAWEDSDLHEIQATPRDAKPVTGWSDRDAAWKDVVERIRAEVLRLRGTPPPAIAPEEVGTSLQEGMAALTMLMGDAEVKETVAGFRTELEVARSQIDIMSDFKDIHDQLHYLKINCYDCILLEASRFPDDDLAREHLDQYLDDIKPIAAKILEIADRKSPVQAEARRIHSRLEQAVDALQVAIGNSDGKKLHEAVSLLKRLLSREPAYINVQLTARTGTWRSRSRTRPPRSA